MKGYPTNSMLEKKFLFELYDLPNEDVNGKLRFLFSLEKERPFSRNHATIHKVWIMNN